MATSQKFSLNLGLPSTPLTNNPELWTEIIKVYNSIKILAGALDAYTGILSEDSQFWEQLGVSRCYDGLNSKFYLLAGEAIPYCATVGLDTSANVRLAVNGGYFAVGFCNNPGGAAIGDIVEVQQRGIVPSTFGNSLVSGSKYYQSGTPGVIGVAGTGTQCIGYAITPAHLYFNPQL